jgi:hypothetical protein
MPFKEDVVPAAHAQQDFAQLAVPATVTASAAAPLPQNNVNRIYLIGAILRGVLGR